VAGGGALPGLLIEACRASGRPFFVLALEGQADHPEIARVPHEWVRLGAAGKSFAIARREGIAEVVFAGKVRRPSLREMQPDMTAARVMIRAAMRAWGDDGLLGAVKREVEKRGLRLVGVHEVAADLVAPPGAYGRIAPDKQARVDIEHGFRIARGIGALDIGQAVIVQQGYVLAVEAAEGTDAMIARAAAYRREGPGGVLVKVKKPKQERRLDLPAIGVHTVEAAAKSGLSGIAVEAGQALVIDRAAVAAAADRLGLFVIGAEAPPS
jgi:hypothetical protein